MSKRNVNQPDTTRKCDYCDRNAEKSSNVCRECLERELGDNEL
jgi:hypothetical protein